MKVRSPMFLHHEPMFRAASRFGRRLWRLGEVPFSFVFLKRHNRLDAADAGARQPDGFNSAYTSFRSVQTILPEVGGFRVTLDFSVTRP